MAESNTERRRGVAPAHILLAALVLFALYALSIGPAVRVAGKDTSSPILQYFYYPLGWLHNHTLLREPLEWYMNLWEKRPPAQ